MNLSLYLTIRLLKFYNEKICLIGGSGILGRYYASQLSKEYEIHVADIGLKDKKKSSSFYTYHLDLQSEAKIKNFFEKNKKRRFDILINNAALLLKWQ